MHDDLLHEVFGLGQPGEIDVPKWETAPVRICQYLHALELCLRVCKGVDVADGLVARAPVVHLFGSLSARAACTQGLQSRVRDKEECPMEGIALAIGRTTPPVVCNAEGECVGWGTQIGHDWVLSEVILEELNTLESATYAVLVQ